MKLKVSSLGRSIKMITTREREGETKEKWQELPMVKEWETEWYYTYYKYKRGNKGKMGFPGGSDSKESSCNVKDLGATPGLGRAPGEGNGYPLQYFCQNSMDRGAWRAPVHGAGCGL